MKKTSERKPQDSAPCPNCSEEVTIPKSTRSFICKSCDAILKAIDKEDGFELKVVGRSVAEDDEYQQIETQIQELKTELGRMHAAYQKEMARKVGIGYSRLGTVGIVIAIIGFPTLLISPQTGAFTILAGAILAAAGYSLSMAQRRAHKTTTSEMVRTISHIGSQRDLLQRRAAQMKTRI